MPPSLFLDARESQVNANLCRDRVEHIFRPMKLKDGSSVVADLTTIGRKSGLPRTVELRFLFFNGNYYATSTKVQGKHWCQNMIADSAVEITHKGEKIRCSAKLVSDEALRTQVLTLRDSPPQLQRVVFEIIPAR
jgi:deazaflavin-dependent oxidoreductase (nitroreductase family)